MTGWEVALVPPGTGGDKPYITADPFSEDVYVYWGASTIHMTASRCAGCDFLDPDPPPPVVARRLSFCSTSHPGTCPGADPSQGAVAAVGPDGEFNIIWLQPNGAIPFLGADWVAHIRYRRGEWNAGGDLDFVPPLPDGLGACLPTEFCCTEEEDCATPIVVGHPGFDVGFRPLLNFTNVGLVPASLNDMKMNSFPSIAVDRNFSSDTCGRGGTVYVAYAAEDLLLADCPDCTDPDADCADPEILGRIIDSNIYLVRGRVSTVDGSMTWSAPVLIEANPQLPPSLQHCADPLGPVPCGIHVPFQFFPWVAVDDDGRVGVMFYDTTPDTLRCDKNIVYRIRFAYSLDGGVTWEFPVTVSDSDSETAPDLDNPSTVFIGDYSGMTAGTDAGVRGIFHPIWTDLREWGGEALDFPNLTAGDIYKGTVTISEPVYSMGDYDRDGDVDTDDFTRSLPARAPDSPCRRCAKSSTSIATT